ncbi:MAG: GspE/PulE family protein [Candidatus Cloacimonadaceae bacterium]|jgi:type IV pilus assembly protein PilB|nr:GspE/PulE family protein [Candidatus Cloacimonadota bacterium]MDY0126747.1 GspE/PulE family protein [Candidatus Cloacimonadaceae bacterium]MCB5255670.1 GspE/PulE family protein [Candidatus Cloacimonadota bacterium]MCK9178336.1 GspE/PulE family protein [Candidatus Cloacimonadota bacterium]MCK9241913.1 GspE/PulE family protein [Candidatus Cloacimonadota bacterium]
MLSSKFAQYLVENEFFTEETMQKAEKKMKEYGGSSASALARVLEIEFGAPHDMVYEALAIHYAFPLYKKSIEEIADKQLDACKSVLDSMRRDSDEEFKRRLLFHKILPFGLQKGSRDILKVLASDPTNQVIQEITSRTQFKRLEIVWAPVKTIDEIIERVAPQKNEFLQLLEEAGQVLGDLEENKTVELDEQELDEEINKSLLVNLFEGCLIEAVRKDASDIHIIPSGKTSADIYFRIDGKLQLWLRQENTPPEALMAVVKDRSTGVDRFERDTAQDGFAQRLVDEHLIRYRISILPIVSQEFERRFESVVIRVIDDRKVITDFRKLGFQEQAEQEFLKSINTSKGIVIVTGPTGSGKSTTLMAALYHVIHPGVNVLTCEDPVEYVIHGARQLKIGHKMSFDQAVRSILRHDPDIVMVGEIRDHTTAETAVKLANTGHLTFSTLHTNDAPSAITRLYKMGIETFLLAYSINIIIAQRLVRRLCPHCRKPLSKESWEAAMQIGVTQEELEQGIIFEPVGCPKCHNGYKGRTNVAEALYFYPEIRAEIIKSVSDIDEDRIRKIAESKGMLSMRDSGLERMREGLTDLTEVLYVTSED